jgi:hypothetical protein
VEIRQTAPGTYEGWFDAGQIGTYLVNVVRENPGSPLEMTVSGLVVPYSPEYRDLQANDYLMTQLAQAGGGVATTNPSDAFGGSRPVVYRPTDLTQWLLALALILLPVDVGMRRLAIEKSDFARAWDWLLIKLGRRRARPRTDAATPELGRLMNAKKSARAPSNTTVLKPTQTAPRPTERPTSRPATPPVRPEPVAPVATAEPVAAEDESGMGRLMAAKRRAQEQAKKESEGG